MRNRFITPDDMDVITEMVLTNVNVPFAWQGKVSRIDVDSIIEFEYGLEIIWDNIDHYAPEETVLAAIFPNSKQICMNEAKRDIFDNEIGAMNFTKAHELGHWILHITEQKDYEQVSFSDNEKYICRSSSKKSAHEIQADMFAASLLMPRGIICGVINDLKEAGNVTFPDLYLIKNSFEVSITALTRRVQDLKLLYIKDKKVYHSEAEALGQRSFL